MYKSYGDLPASEAQTLQGCYLYTLPRTVKLMQTLALDRGIEATHPARADLSVLPQMIKR